MAKATTKPPAAKNKLVVPLDPHCTLKKAAVVGDWDATLNQTNIGANNNKFYVIQLVQAGTKFHTWTRWGRVGEDGQMALLGKGTLAEAEKAFQAKFKDKTGNAWADRAKFAAKKGRYTLIELDRSADAAKKAEEIEGKLKKIDAAAAKVQPKTKHAPSKLSPPLQSLVSLIFDKDVFKDAMASFDIDVNKMPLGQLTQGQVKRGFEVLEALEDAIESRKTKGIVDLSSRFYTLIPHAFGRKVPPPISSSEVLQKKFDMLNVLSDIEVALGMDDAPKAAKTTLHPHPADAQYKKLNADLLHVPAKGEEYEMVKTYMERTMGGYKLKLVDLFQVDRHGEKDRFAEHSKLSERKLLWHGTNVAVVAAILKSGLRIMPHSGGRVGKGIYLASENGKSAGYVGWSGKTGIMFLVEAALGKEHAITRDDHRLKAAPKGYHSIVARGRSEPDPKHDIEFSFDGKKVVVPQGKPIKTSYKSSSFSQSEYLIYKESQARLRYVLRVQH